MISKKPNQAIIYRGLIFKKLKYHSQRDEPALSVPWLLWWARHLVSIRYNYLVWCICQQKLFIPSMFPFPLLKHFSGTFLVLPESSLHSFVFSPSTKMWGTSEGTPSESSEQFKEEDQKGPLNIFYKIFKGSFEHSDLMTSENSDKQHEGCLMKTNTTHTIKRE